MRLFIVQKFSLRVLRLISCLACNLKHRYAIRLKFEDKLLTSLTELTLEAKASIYYKIKENLTLYFRKFLAFVVLVMI